MSGTNHQVTFRSRDYLSVVAHFDLEGSELRQGEFQYDIVLEEHQGRNGRGIDDYFFLDGQGKVTGGSMDQNLVASKDEMTIEEWLVKNPDENPESFYRAREIAKKQRQLMELEELHQRHNELLRELREESKDRAAEVLDDVANWQEQSDAASVEEQRRIQERWEREEERLEAVNQTNQRILGEAEARIAIKMEEMAADPVTYSPPLTEEEQRIEQGVRYHGGFSSPTGAFCATYSVRDGDSIDWYRKVVWPKAVYYFLGDNSITREMFDQAVMVPVRE